MRATDTLMSIPTLLLVIVFVAAIGPSLVQRRRRHRPARLAWRLRLVRGQILSSANRSTSRPRESSG